MPHWKESLNTRVPFFCTKKIPENHIFRQNATALDFLFAKKIKLKKILFVLPMYKKRVSFYNKFKK